VLSKQLAAYRVGAAVASALPGEVASGAAQGLGALLGRLPDYDGRRAVVASHMARVLGRQLGRPERRRIVAEVYGYYSRYWAESLRLASVPQAQVTAGVSVSGDDHLEAATALGRGVIIVTPHLGGWEWGGRYLIGEGLPVSVAVETVEPPDLFEWFERFREQLGFQVVAVGPGAAATLLQALKEKHAVCLLSDRLVGQASGVEVSFFGQGAMLPAGPATLALRSGAPVLPGAIYFGKGANSHRVVFRPPIELPTGLGFRHTVRAVTQSIAIDLEHLIRQAPTQWHLLQPNWPGDPSLHSPSAWARREARALVSPRVAE
jgi:phosphatidylinositol dimannoside acyltransferase